MLLDSMATTLKSIVSRMETSVLAYLMVVPMLTAVLVYVVVTCMVASIHE